MTNLTVSALRGRAAYKLGERAEKVKRLSTRVAPVLGAYINEISATVAHGYRNRTQMLSQLMCRYLEERPWDADVHGPRALLARGGKREDPAFHIELQEVAHKGAATSGADLRSRVMRAADSANVSGSTFMSTFLWWIALDVHAPKRGSAIERDLRSVPIHEADKRFTGFLRRP